MPFDPITRTDVLPGAESSYAALDCFVHGALAELTSGLSPVLAAQAWLDWISHLGLSPGKQAQLLALCQEAALRLGGLACGASAGGGDSAPDRRFADDGWQRWPYNVIKQSYLMTEAWWRSATTGVRGMSRHHEQLVSFGAHELLQALSPANFPATNPQFQRVTAEKNGTNLVEGAGHFAADTYNLALGKHPVDDTFAVGKNLAMTKGKIVYRNELIELIQYEPATPDVFAEPVLIVPAWIMKYYILDLQPNNSMIGFLVNRGHTVFAISWKNPTAEHRDLGMEDYRQRGVMAALDAVEQARPGRKIHACGYCLGGTLLAIAGAAMARDGDERLASITLLTAQTDFTEPGELKLFIDDTSLAWLDGLMASRGYLEGSRMGGSFQLLRAEDLLWTPFVRRYLLGETDHPNDLMAWNTDQTRMPYRMHTEYLHSLFLRNELVQGHFIAGSRPVALGDIRIPIFALGTTADHVAPWRSAFKIHLHARGDITFALTSGGHNAGVVSEPGHPHRTYQLLEKEADDRYLDPDTWLAQAPVHDGSWWFAWQRWLADRSSGKETPPAIAEALCDAPGTYVFER